MRAINISNIKARNAQVGLEQKGIKPTVTMRREDGIGYTNARFLKATPTTSIEVLYDKFGENLADEIIYGDPEIDLEMVGMRLGKVKKVFLDNKGKVAYRVLRQQVRYSPEGEEMEVKKFHTTESNVNIDFPLWWTGKLIPKDKAVRTFAFVRKYQLKHINGLTFDFLYDMAKMLDEKNCMMLVGAGSKGIGPLVMSTGGTPYRAFLEGRVKDDKYCLLLHLTNLELKSLINNSNEQL